VSLVSFDIVIMPHTITYPLEYVNQIIRIHKFSNTEVQGVSILIRTVLARANRPAKSGAVTKRCVIVHM
jgi:hypothetical protein